MKCADRKYLLKEAQRTLDESDSTAAFCLCQRWIIKDAIALLKKQEPIQPKKVLQAGAAREYYRCFCPECGTHVGNILNGERADIVSYFCQNCGQAVKWE